MQAPTILSLYQEWLRGSSLRALAKKVGCYHGALHTAFRKQYGNNACSVKAKSLVRSVIEDYEGNEEVIKWALSLYEDDSSDYHRSKHSLQQLSNFQTLREEYILNTIEAPETEEPEDSWDFLRLPLYDLYLRAIISAINSACAFQYGCFVIETDTNIIE